MKKYTVLFLSFCFMFTLLNTNSVFAQAERFQSRKNDFDSRTEKLNGLKSERQMLLGGEDTNVHRGRFENALKNARDCCRLVRLPAS